MLRSKRRWRISSPLLPASDNDADSVVSKRTWRWPYRYSCIIGCRLFGKWFWEGGDIPLVGSSGSLAFPSPKAFKEPLSRPFVGEDSAVYPFLSRKSGDYTCRKVRICTGASLPSVLIVSHQENESRCAMDFENYDMVISSHIVGISVHFVDSTAGFQSYDMVTRLSPLKIDGFSELPTIAD